MRQFAVIGLGRFGSSVARTLSDRGFEVLAIDSDEGRVAQAAEFCAHAVRLDATDERALKEVGIGDLDVVIVSIGENLEASTLITLLLKELGVETVVSKALNELHGKILRKIGADRVVFPERDMGVRVAESLTTPSISDYIELSPTHSILELTAPESFANKNLKDLDLRARYGVTVIAIKRKLPRLTPEGDTELSENIVVAPRSEEKILKGDLLMFLGRYEDLERVRKL